jgi:hypothetical protein
MFITKITCGTIQSWETFSDEGCCVGRIILNVLGPSISWIVVVLIKWKTILGNAYSSGETLRENNFQLVSLFVTVHQLMDCGVHAGPTNHAEDIPILGMMPVHRCVLSTRCVTHDVRLFRS